MKRVFLSLVLICGAVGLAGCQRGFVEKDVQNLKEQIRKEFSSRPGVIVKDVQIIKESSKKLTGFAKLSAGGREVIKNCSATWGEGGKYIWKCE